MLKYSTIEISWLLSHLKRDKAGYRDANQHERLSTEAYMNTGQTRETNLAS